MVPPSKHHHPDLLDPMQALLRVLASLTQSSLPLSPDDLILEHGIDLSMAQKAFRALEAEGIITSEIASGRYVISTKFLAMMKVARMHACLERKIRPLMRHLADASGESVTFNTYERGADTCVCLMVEHSPAPLHYVVEVGEHKALHAGASGKAVLAGLSDEEIDSYIARTGLPPVTPLTTTDPAMLRRNIARIRRLGYAQTRGQRLEGAMALAAGVTMEGSIRGSIVITIPAHRFKQANRDRLAAYVIETAGNISSILEGRDAS
jgi:IclR family acetate operon transcriptional repressor